MIDVPFVGRKKELKLLNELFAKKGTQIVVLTGRRRIGKTRLIQEFAKNKTLINQSENLPMLSKAVLFFDELSLKDLSFLENPVFKKPSELMIVLCSSNAAWMEKTVLKSSFFLDKVDFLRIHLSELSLAESNFLLEEVGFNRSIEEKLQILSVTGGIPYYISLINPKYSVKENIQSLRLENEFQEVFFEVLGRKGQLHRNVLDSLSKGPLEYSSVASLVNYTSSGALSDCLEELILLGFIERDHTWCLKTGAISHRLSKYRLSDNYLLFHFNAKNANLPLSNLILRNRLSIFHMLGLKKEDVLLDNPYFQHKTRKLKECQIDYLIQTRHNTLYACEIKYDEKELDVSVIASMKEKIAKMTLPRGFACFPILIHVNGVAEEVVRSNFFFKLISF